MLMLMLLATLLLPLSVPFCALSLIYLINLLATTQQSTIHRTIRKSLVLCVCFPYQVVVDVDVAGRGAECSLF